MENTIIVINDEPYCIWDDEIKQKNFKFIDGIDENFFAYSLDTHHKSDEKKELQLLLESHIITHLKPYLA